MSTRFALTTTSGITVDGHFSKAESFNIYELDRKQTVFVERRICRCPGGHTCESIEEKKRLLSDCCAVFVSRIGKPVAEQLIAEGIRVFEAPLPIDTILWQIEAGNLRLNNKKERITNDA